MRAPACEMGLARALRLASLSALAAVAQERACGAPEDDATAVGAQLLQRAAEVSRPGPDGTAEPGLLQGGASVEALRAVDDLWSGLDSVPQAAYQDLLQSAANVSPALGGGPAAAPAGPDSATDDDAAGSGGGARPTLLQIAGMFDSGTNLLWALIRANLGERAMGRVCPDEKSGQCFFWKHSPPRQLQRELDALERKGQRVVLVAMVRSPLSQVVSWTKAPYDLGSCIQRATATAGSDSRTRCYVRGEPFTGVTGVWNSYVQEYDRRQGANGDAYHRTLVVEYERLVLEPEAVVREIAAALGLPARSAFRTIEAPAKNHGRPHGREKALQDLQEAAWLRRQPASRREVRSSLCSRLNSSAMKAHAYPTVPRPGSYLDDCA